MLANLSGWHFLIVALVVLLLFGATRLPALAKSVGQSAKIFRREVKDLAADDATASQPGEVTEPVAAAGGSADPR
jgi:sec-independent protein translocase protein TatA